MIVFAIICLAFLLGAAALVPKGREIYYVERIEQDATIVSVHADTRQIARERLREDIEIVMGELSGIFALGPGKDKFTRMVIDTRIRCKQRELVRLERQLERI